MLALFGDRSHQAEDRSDVYILQGKLLFVAARVGRKRRTMSFFDLAGGPFGGGPVERLHGQQSAPEEWSAVGETHPSFLDNVVKRTDDFFHRHYTQMKVGQNIDKY